jgi:hypothetical protein
VFEAVRRITEARGARTLGEPLSRYEEGGLEFFRTAVSEYKVRREGWLVFMAKHTGGCRARPSSSRANWSRRSGGLTTKSAAPTRGQRVSGYYDEELTCADCGGKFLHSAKDQEFFAGKGYQEPRRCKPCRQAKKEQRGGDGRGRGGNR